MAQVKKVEVRNAILDSAYLLFKEKGYLNCKMSQIAAAAGTAASNMYVYFPSKVHLFYEVFGPILEAQLDALSVAVNRISEPREKLRLILMTVWQDIVREDNYFAHNLMEAIISTREKEKKPHGQLAKSVERIQGMLFESLPVERQHLLKDSSIAYLILMAFDGFVINAKIEEIDNMDALVDRVCDLLLGS